MPDSVRVIGTCGRPLTYAERLVAPITIPSRALDMQESARDRLGQAGAAIVAQEMMASSDSGAPTRRNTKI